MKRTTAQKIEDLGGRKFFLAVVILLISAAGFVADKMTGSDWVMVASIVMGAFAAGNAIEHNAKKSDYDPAG